MTHTSSTLSPTAADHLTAAVDRQPSSPALQEIKPTATVEVAPDYTDAPASPPDAHEDYVGTLPFSYKLANLSAVVLPLAGLVIALAVFWGTAFNWVYLGIMVGMYLLTGLGITVGYHRLFTHKSFETGPIGTWFWAVAGSMAMEGPVLRWAALHRMHHQHSDHDKDPHSPHAHPGPRDGLFSIVRGLWHSHVGWLFTAYPPDLERYVKDLQADPVVARVSRQFGLWTLVGMVVPAILGGLLTWSWQGIFLGFLWGGPVRVFVVHHITWSINSVCHIWGSRPFNSHDESRNNAIFGVLAFGEGWHNNHHAFPTSARHGLKWWQIDTSYMIIRGMEMLGMAKRVRVPSPDRMAAKLRHPH